MTLDPNTTPPTKSALFDVTYLSLVIGVVTTAWQQTGWHIDWLGQFQTIAPIIVQALCGLGIVTGHAISIVSPPKKLTILPSTPPTAPILLAALLLPLTLASCQTPPVTPTNLPTTQPAPGLTIGESRLILLLERGGYAYAVRYVANAHFKGVELAAANAGLAGLKQRIDDNTAAVNAGKPIDLSTADNSFNVALDEFLANVIPVPIPTP